MKRDHTRSKSNFFWRIHANIEQKKERFISARQFYKYWDETPKISELIKRKNNES